ncbi:hypothetical protein FQZ97_294270 [compost metagenome]
MDVHGLGSGTNNLFERVSDRLFSPLASANRQGFWSLLCHLHRRRFGPDAPLPPSYGFVPRVLLQDIEDHIRYAPAWQPEDGEEPDTPLNNRAISYFHRLLDSGWFREERHGLTPTFSMAPSVNQLLTLLIGFAETGPVFVSGKIRSIDGAIAQVLKGEAGGDLLREAAEQCRNLLVHIRNTGTNVRDLMGSIAKQETTAEYVRTFFREYVERVFIGDYLELRTREHPLSKRQQILDAVDEIGNNPEHRHRLLDWYLTRLTAGDKAKAEAAFERDLYRLGELNRIEEYLERLDDEVRTANKRALVVLHYRLRAIRPIDDLLRRVIDDLVASGLAGDFDGPWEDLPRVFAPEPLIGGERLAPPRKETVRQPPSPLRHTALSEHARAIGNLQRLAQERRRMTPAKLRAYAALALGDADHVASSELPVDGVEELRAYQSFASLAMALNSNIPNIAMRARGQIPGLDVPYDGEESVEHPYLTSRPFEIRLRKRSSRTEKKDSP